jgi:hypothetical protein
MERDAKRLVLSVVTVANLTSGLVWCPHIPVLLLCAFIVTKKCYVRVPFLSGLL